MAVFAITCSLIFFICIEGPVVFHRQQMHIPCIHNRVIILLAMSDKKIKHTSDYLNYEHCYSFRVPTLSLVCDMLV